MGHRSPVLGHDADACHDLIKPLLSDPPPWGSLETVANPPPHPLPHTPSGGGGGEPFPKPKMDVYLCTPESWWAVVRRTITGPSRTHPCTTRVFVDTGG